jgi:hypothetical protein
MIGGSGYGRPVYFGKDSSGFYVAIGDGSGTWEYPAISIRDLQVSYANPLEATWATGWSIIFDTSNFSGSSLPRVSQPVPGDAVFGLNALETWGGAVATLPNFKTSQGTAAGITGQGALATQNVITASLLDSSVVHEVAAASATNVGSTDNGAVLVSVANVTARPSQGGKVVILLTADISGTSSTGKDYLRGYAVLQRSPAGAGTWTQVGTAWRMAYFGKIQGFSNYSDVVDDGAGGWKAAVVGGYAQLGLKQAATIGGVVTAVSAANQWIDTPPSDADYDYRVVFSNTSTPGTASPPEAGTITANTAELMVLSVKVAA